MKIGILTYHRANNYGAFLQAQALCCRLNQELDLEAEIIDFNMKCAEEKYSPKLTRSAGKWLRHPETILFDRKLREAFSHAFDNCPGKLSADCCVSDEIEDFQKFVKGKYDLIIAGSDEIWKTDGFRGFPTPYWLPGDLGCRKFAYAASSRSDFSTLSEKQLALLEQYLADFSYIGVRDQMTADEVARHVSDKGKVHLCCDPVFLYDLPSQESAEVQKAYADKKRKNILLMTGNEQISRDIYNQYHESCNLVSVFHWHKGYKNLGDLNPFQWIYAIEHADFVITTYFHASCFCIILNIPFAAIGVKNKSEKLEELLNSSELKKRFLADWKGAVSDGKAYPILEQLMEREDYSGFVKEKRAEFDCFLQALRNPADL